MEKNLIGLVLLIVHVTLTNEEHPENNDILD